MFTDAPMSLPGDDIGSSEEHFFQAADHQVRYMIPMLPETALGRTRRHMVDMRSAEEYANGHLPEAENIPLHQMF